MSAVEVRSGYKYYGKEKDPKIVLNRINMTVTHGSMWVSILVLFIESFDKMNMEILVNDIERITWSKQMVQSLCEMLNKLDENSRNIFCIYWFTKVFLCFHQNSIKPWRHFIIFTLNSLKITPRADAKLNYSNRCWCLINCICLEMLNESLNLNLQCHSYCKCLQSTLLCINADLLFSLIT